MINRPSLEYLIDSIANQDSCSEVSLALFLDARSHILAASMAEGGPDRVELPAAAILDCGKSLGAHQIMLFHTHPSGDPRPSRHDIAITRRLCAGLRHQGQRLMDHVILTNSRFFSFRANGLI